MRTLAICAGIYYGLWAVYIFWCAVVTPKEPTTTIRARYILSLALVCAHCGEFFEFACPVNSEVALPRHCGVCEQVMDMSASKQDHYLCGLEG